MIATETPAAVRALPDLDEALAIRRPVLIDGNTEDLVLEGGAVCHLVPFLARRGAEAGLTPLTVAMATGAQLLEPPGTPTRDHIADRFGPRDEPAEGLRSLIGLLEDPEARVMVIVDYPEHLAPQQPASATPDQLVLIELLLRLLTSPRIQASGNALVLVARRGTVDPAVRRACQGVNLPLPDATSRGAFLELLAERHAVSPEDFAPVPDAEAVVRVSGGLRLDDLARLSRLAVHLEVPLTSALVVNRKRALIREQAEDVLEVHMTPHGFDAVAGLDHLREWTDSLVASGAYPKGVLLVGPPGLGKSFIVKSLAHTLDLPLVSLRLVRSMWVGETERRLERALAIILALAPAVVWLDEIDTILPARTTATSADGGTSERVTGRLLEVMGDFAANHGVLWVGTTNFVDRLDTALQSRMPAVFPFFHPTPCQIVRLLPVLADQASRTIAPDVDLAAIANRPQLAFASARDLTNILTEAARFADDERGTGSPITSRDLADAVANRWRVADPRAQERLALVGLTWCDSAARLPWRTRNDNRDGVEVPTYLQPLLDDGLPVADRIEARLRELNSFGLMEMTL